MWNYFKEHTKPFKTGCAVSAPVWGYILFSDASVFIGEFAIRLALAAMVAFVSGLFTSLATDFYKELKSRIKSRKKKQDAKRRKEFEDGKRKECA